jgi:hypothetical protein
VSQPAPTPEVAASGVEQPSARNVLRDVLPERTVDDVLQGIVRLTLGGQPVTLSVLPIRDNRAWKDRANNWLGAVLPQLEAPDATRASIIAFLSGMTEMQLELLYAYDKAGVLPDRGWVEEHATETELLVALLGVLAAAFPFVATALDVLRSAPDLGRALTAYWLHTSTARQSTDGRPLPLSVS